MGLSAAMIAAAAFCVPAGAAPPQVIGETTSVCNAGDSGRSYAIPLNVPRPAMFLQRMTLAGPDGSGAFWSGDGGGTLGVGAGDTGWTTSDSPGGTFGPFGGGACADTITATVTAFAIPTAPTQFSGRSRQDFLDGNSTIAFNVPGEAPYVMDVQLQEGPLRIRTSSVAPGQVIATSGSVALGSLPRGEKRYGLLAATGQPVTWSVGLRALPVPLAAGSPKRTVFRPGQTVAAPYTTEGDTTVSAQVIPAGGGGAVRNLGGAPGGRGSHNFFWDGRDDFARDVPDGGYLVALSSADPSGLGSTAAFQFIVDATRPEATLLSSSIAATGTLALRVADPTSGLASSTIKLNGRDVSRLVATGPDGVSRLRPRSGRFDIGSHRLQIRAVDVAGNVASVSERMTVRGSALAALRVRPTRSGVAVKARSGVSGPAQITVTRSGRRIGGCRANAVAGRPFSCLARTPFWASGSRASVRIGVRSSELGITHRRTRTLRLS